MTADFAAFRPVLREEIGTGDTDAIDPGLYCESVRTLWTETSCATSVAQIADGIRGPFYLRSNHPRGGAQDRWAILQ